MRTRRRRRGARGPSAGDLVLVAAEATGAGPDEVLAGTDVEVLVGIAGRTLALAEPVAAAAEVLVGVAAGRPFPRANAAIAWLAAVHVLAERGVEVAVDDDEAAELVHGARLGRFAEAEVQLRLARCTAPVPGPGRRLAHRLGALATATRAVPVHLAVCPVCDRVVGGSGRWPLAPGLGGDAFVRAAVCAREHGHHDAHGAARRPPAPSAPPRWCPVAGGAPGEAPFVALTDGGPVAFVPTGRRSGDREGDGGCREEPADGELAVVLVDELAPSDLVGTGERLCDRGEVIGRVPVAACRLDPTGTAIDWHAVIAAVPEGALAPA